MRSTPLLYRGAMRLGRMLIPAATLFDSKLRAGHRGRAGTISRFAQWARSNRSRSAPLVWFHAPSVGEGLQAEAVIVRIRERHPDWQLAYTYFSPSAEAHARRLGVDIDGYLPYDLPKPADAMLDALAPSVLVFTKLDLWPELSTRAANRHLPVALIAATVRPNSGRLRWPVRPLLRAGYAAVTEAGAVADSDAARLSTLGVPSERIAVLGDSRFDSVVDRMRAVRADDPLLRFGAGAPTLVAGSTWPGDEDVLLDAFSRLHVHRPDARLIVVPHEPTSAHLERLETEARKLGLPAPVRLSAASGPVPLLLIDRVGVLAALYGSAMAAWVGGGYHSAGLHSVLEPAAWGIPVAFGPRWTESRDAELLLAAGGAHSISELGETESGETLAALWESWLTDTARRNAEGRKAAALVASGAGAADRTVSMIERLVAR